MTSMDSNTIRKALDTLNALLKRNSQTLEMLVVGGTHMCLIQGSRDATFDIDVFCPTPAKLQDYCRLVRQIYPELPYDWINTDSAVYVTAQIKEDALVMDQYSNLTIYTPTDQAMLALKVTSGRMAKDKPDLQDAAFLIRKLGITTPHEIEHWVKIYTPLMMYKFSRNDEFIKQALQLAK